MYNQCKYYSYDTQILHHLNNKYILFKLVNYL